MLPDNCLFEDKADEVFEIVMQDCRVHTILRLLRGTFTPYSQGVNANVIFLQKGAPTTESGSTTHEATSQASQKGPTTYRGTLQRIREALRERPQRPGQT